MPQISMRDAINQALHQEMARDPRVIVLGEDVSGGAGGTSGEREAAGGIFGVTKGLLPKFGAGRVIDTPISRVRHRRARRPARRWPGLRPVAELMFADFVGVCMDQIYNQIAKFRYMFGGKTTCPVVIRMAMGAGMNMGAQHIQSIYALLTAVPGLKVVVPSNAYDAKGLMIQAIRDDDPVMFFEHKALYPRKAEVPEEAYTVPFRRGERAARGRRCHRGGHRPHGDLRGEGARWARRRGHQVRPDRPAHHLAAGCEDDPRERREHRAAHRGR